jgi:hypothetical protein
LGGLILHAVTGVMHGVGQRFQRAADATQNLEQDQNQNQGQPHGGEQGAVENLALRLEQRILAERELHAVQRFADGGIQQRQFRLSRCIGNRGRANLAAE